MLNSLMDKIIDEVSYSGLARKQKTITRLFPQFPDRVKKIAGMGGLRLHKVKPDLWHFKVHSGTKDDVWYDDYVKFKNIDEILRKHTRNKKIWNKTGTHVLLPKLAKEVLFDTDMQLSCSCPAQLYYGGDYILSLNKYDAKYGKPETRPPKIKNPRQYGAYCKHLQNVINVLPWYESTMAKYLKQFYLDDIRKYEQEVLDKERPSKSERKPSMPSKSKKKTMKKDTILRKLKKRTTTKPKESKANEDRFSDVFKPISKEEIKKRDRERLEDVLKEQGCTLNPDGTYSCRGNVDISDMGLTKIPVRFKEVKGGFYCSNNQLKTLEGAPESVGRDFSCRNNQLNTLEGAPEKVGGDFDCFNNNLETLEGAPETVGGNFWCEHNNLISLKGAPEKLKGVITMAGNPISKKLGKTMIKGSELHKYI